MANTITKTTLIDGKRNLVQLINIAGDGSGDETNTLLVDRSTFAPTDGTETVVEKIEGTVGGFTATLSFDATADLNFVRLSDGDWVCHNWQDSVGGVSSNKAGAGANGDILLTTSGLGAGEGGTFILHMRKA